MNVLPVSLASIAVLALATQASAQAASVTINGPACEESAALTFDITFTPNGLGGYTTSLSGSMDVDFASGTDLGLTDNSITTVALAFPFPMPGGTVTAQLDVDSNGRLTEAGNLLSDPTESVSEFVNDPTASVAAFWDDLDPGADGSVWLNLSSNGAQSLTWDGVPDALSTESNTFQVQLWPDGSISLHFVEMSASDGLVGLSPGNGAIDPGVSDLSLAGFSSADSSVVYQQFNGDQDLPPLPSLSNLTLPVLGTNFELEIRNGPGSIGDFYLLGNPSVFDLSSLGVPCTLETDGVLATIQTPPGSGLSLSLPNVPSLIGQSLNAQAAMFDLAADNPFTLLLTNSVDFTFGSF